MSAGQQFEHPVAAQVAKAAVESAATTMRQAGVMPRPTVHLFMDGLDQPYAGFVTCRTFYRGVDAAKAIARLGEFPASMHATRLVLMWENADLLTALSRRP